MNKKLLITIILSVVAIFFVIKINNYSVGKKILEYTEIDSKYLKIVPLERGITSNSNFKGSFLSSLSELKFSIPRIDTFKIFRLRDVYVDFMFNDSASLKVIKDSINLHISEILSSIKSSDNNTIKAYITDKHLSSKYDLLLHAYNKSPDDISFFNLTRSNTILQYTFLKLKDLCLVNGADKALYYFKLKNIKGFQFGAPNLCKRTIVQIFTNNDQEYTLLSVGLKQEEIDYILVSIDKLAK
jgi:hypothetical protein